VNQNDNNFLYTWGEHTPIKDCGNFGYDLHLGGKFFPFAISGQHGSQICIMKGNAYSDKTNKVVEESRGSQFKRRRILQFTPDSNDTHIDNELTSFASENSKVGIGLK